MAHVAVLYHTDHDGECSAAIMLRDPYDQPRHVVQVPVNYHMEPPWDLIQGADEVWIVDFSLTEFQWHSLLGTVCPEDIPWIDHHITALDRATGEPWEHLRGLRRVGTAACALTWEFLWGDDDVAFAIPPLVEYIADRDTWTFALGDGPRYVHAAMEALHDTSPKSPFWDAALEPYPTERSVAMAADQLASLEIVGKQLLEKRVLADEQYLLQWGFEVEFEGLRGIVCMGRRGSEVFNSMVDFYDVLIPTQYDGHTWNLTLYPGAKRPDLDCAAIALKYGGGGHKGAAGLRTETQPWKFVRALNSGGR